MYNVCSFNDGILIRMFVNVGEMRVTCMYKTGRDVSGCV